MNNLSDNHYNHQNIPHLGKKRRRKRRKYQSAICVRKDFMRKSERRDVEHKSESSNQLKLARAQLEHLKALEIVVTSIDFTASE